MSESLNTQLKKYINPNNPLGPTKAEDIESARVAAKLFDPHNTSYSTLLKNETSIVLGRRGSGKTALLKNYEYRKYLNNKKESKKLLGEKYEIVIEIDSGAKFLAMQTSVASVPAGVLKPIEVVVEDWAKLIVDYFLATFAKQEISRIPQDLLRKIRTYLSQEHNDFEQRVREKVWGPPLWSWFRNIWISNNVDTSVLYISKDVITELVDDYLKQNKRKTIIIFDSMDSYDIGNPSFDRTVGALLRFIDNFNSKYTNIKIKLGLPSEIYDEIQRASDNPLKDLKKCDQVVWSAMELMQVAAHRFALFLELYDRELAETLGNLDLTKRDDVHSFWGMFFPSPHINRYGQEEEVLVYLLRHTHLLPRQLLTTLSEIIVINKRLSKGYRKFLDKAVLDGVEKSEGIIAIEIFTAFRRVYPEAENIGLSIFGNFPTVFSYEELESQWNRHGRYRMSLINSVFEMVDLTQMLIRMGIIGVVENETELYFEAEFAYNSLSRPNIGSGNRLCLHPIFSRHFRAALNDKKKAILPKGVMF